MFKSLKEYKPTSHFILRLQQRFYGDIQYIYDNSMFLCTRNNYNQHLIDKNGKVYIIHSRIKERELVTIYEVSPETLFRDFMKIYITKPQQMRHQFKKRKTWGRLFSRIMSKLNNKLKMYCNHLYVEQYINSSIKMRCKEYYAQIIYDYLNFFLEYLNENFTEMTYNNYLRSTGIVIDKSKMRKDTVKGFLCHKFSSEQLEKFYFE
jgi:hypothetical protein